MCAGLCLLALSACNAVLGIKTLEPGAQSGTQEDGVTAQAGHDSTAPVAGAGGTSATPSGAAGTGAQPAAGSGGKPASGNPSKNPSTNPPAGGASAPALPPAGSGGAAGPTMNPGPSKPDPNQSTAGAAAPSGNVTGRVIDHARRAVPGVNVRIGDKTAQTDAEGRFTLEAPATYDVTLNFDNGSYRKGPVLWQVQGLTRRNPTLQVDRALPSHDATATITFAPLSPPLTSSQHINLAWLSPDGAFSHMETAENGVEASIGWTGPQASIGVAHALEYEVMGSPALPISYLAYAARPLTLQEGQRTELSLELSQSVTSAAISGSVAGPGTDRHQLVYLCFDDATSMPLLEDTRVQSTFSYLVPRLSNTTLAVFARDGLLFQGSTASYVGNIAPGQSDVALKLRAVPSLTAPAAGATGVTSSTMFSWNTDAGVSLVAVNLDGSEDMAVIVTAKKQTVLPFGAGPGLSPGPGVLYDWHVEVHNDFASVDEAAGEMGFLYPAADLRGSGSYADSQTWTFTTQ